MSALFSLILIYFNLIIFGFIFLGLFLVSSLNTFRSYISDNAINKASVYGIFYGGIAISSSIGTIIIGEIWQKFGEKYALIYSLAGIFTIFLLYLSKISIKKAFND